MLNRRWFTPKEREAYRRRMALERQATQLIRSTDRRRANEAPPNPPKLNPAPAPTESHRQYRLSDLTLLRRRGLVP
jgi:hypothetical protein